MAIGDVIKERRKKLDMTQKQLAEMIRVTPQAISKWEKGSGCPDISYIAPLANAGGVQDVINDFKSKTENLRTDWISPFRAESF